MVTRKAIRSGMGGVQVCLSKFKFKCVDCGATQSLSMYDVRCRSKPHCLDCGSTFLEAASKQVWKKIAIGNSAQSSQYDRFVELTSPCSLTGNRKPRRRRGRNKRGHK